MKFYELPASLDDDTFEYERLIKAWLEGKISKAKLKAHRVPMGVYEQRDNERYMMRIRLPGGGITPSQLVHVASVAEKYTNWSLHFTTRQDVQIHNLSLTDTVKVMHELKELGLSSRGGGGNTVRNIVGSYDAGIDPDTVFDVAPYITALSTRLVAEPDSWTLPRKFKIAFSGSSRDTGLATMADLGFIAKKNDRGQRGFSVYIAGGMGHQSRVATRLYSFVGHDQVYNITKAIKNLFDKYGNRKRKHAARLRFLFEKLGKVEFFRRIEEERVIVARNNSSPFELSREQHLHGGFLEVPLFLGDMSVENARKLGNVMQRYGEDTIRVMPHQNLLLRNIPKDMIKELRLLLKEESVLEELPPFLGRATACAGASTCKLGICLSRGLLTAVRKELERRPFAFDRVNDISLKISGCPNTCGRHIIADMGFFGGVKRIGDRSVPFYKLMIGGVVEEGNTRLAQRIFSLPAKCIPEFLTEFLQFVGETRSSDEPFSEYLERVGKEKLLELSARYGDVPPFEENQDYYRDWGSDQVFSLLEKMEGECSAGLFDLIELDLQQAESGREQLNLTKEEGDREDILRMMVVNASRALLITKGLEARTDSESVTLFRRHFIGRHIEGKYSALLAGYDLHRTIDAEMACDFLKSVRDLYESMDDSLHFPELARDCQAAAKALSVVRIFRDFRGVACPLNFVKTKLILETMEAGETLEILLDNGEPIENVPASVLAEGHQVLQQNRVYDHWSVVIQKERV